MKATTSPITASPFLLALLSLASLSFISYVDKAAAAALTLVSGQLAPLAYARFPSFSLALLILAFVDQSALSPNWGKVRWRPLVRASLFWLVPAAVGVFYVQVWVPKIEGWIDVTAFMVTGLCAEEFLFRGALYALAERTFGSRTILRLPVPVLYTAVFFGLQHLQYHSFQVNPASLTQVGYTVVMGVFFGLIRYHGHSVWPVVAVHFVNNTFTIFRNVMG